MAGDELVGSPHFSLLHKFYCGLIAPVHRSLHLGTSSSNEIKRRMLDLFPLPAYDLEVMPAPTTSRRRGRDLFLVPAVAVLALAGCRQTSPRPLADIDMIFWEEQSWESGGDSRRLTLWADGRSEIRIVLGDQTPRSGTVRLRLGWTNTDGALVKRGALSAEDAGDRFERALKAGIHLLEPVHPNYVDGGGTLVGVRVGGSVREVVIAHLADNWRQTTNYRRFQVVAEVMSNFDRDALQRQQ